MAIIKAGQPKGIAYYTPRSSKGFDGLILSSSSWANYAETENYSEGSSMLTNQCDDSTNPMVAFIYWGGALDNLKSLGNITITKITIKGSFGKHWYATSTKTLLSYRFITNFSSNNNTYAKAGEASTSLWNGNAPNSIQTFENEFDDQSDVVIWANENISKIKNGSTLGNFGVRLYGANWRLYYMYLTIEYTINGIKNIYVGDKQATKIYIGNQEITSAYSGDTLVFN